MKMVPLLRMLRHILKSTLCFLIKHRLCDTVFPAKEEKDAGKMGKWYGPISSIFFQSILT